MTIADEILATRRPHHAPPPLYGLVLVGGRSKRMNRDKATLDYHGVPQARRTYELLDTHCELVFLSSRKEQGDLPGYVDFPQIFDAFPFESPLNGILSALRAGPCAAWLVAACDLPYLTPKTVEHLIVNRNPDKWATAFISVYDGLPEPLCAIYEPAAYEPLMACVNEGILCPRQALARAGEAVELLAPLEPRALDNVNTPEEYKTAIKDLRQR